MLHKRRWQSGLTQFCLNLPLPVRDRTVAETIPKANDHPAKKCDSRNNEMPFPRFIPNPPKEVKPNDDKMNDIK